GGDVGRGAGGGGRGGLGGAGGPGPWLYVGGGRAPARAPPAMIESHDLECRGKGGDLIAHEYERERDCEVVGVALLEARAGTAASPAHIGRIRRPGWPPRRPPRSRSAA